MEIDLEALADRLIETEDTLRKELRTVAQMDDSTERLLRRERIVEVLRDYLGEKKT